MSTFTHQFTSMNTQVDVTLTPFATVEIKDVFLRIQELFTRVETTCSRFLADSELSMLNHLAPNEVRSVSPTLFHILREAERAYYLTNGMFQPGILRQLVLAGYDSTFEELQQEREARTPFELHSPPPGLPYEIIDVSSRLIRVKVPQSIDLGGIAKGWCVDQASELASTIGSGFINAGGDLRVFGRQEEAWKVGIEDPLQLETNKAIVHLTKGALATSSTHKRKWKVGDAWRHHIIDPRAGIPSDSMIISATVLAPTAMLADISAKTLLILGEEAGRSWLHSQHLHGFIILDSGEFRRL